MPSVAPGTGDDQDVTGGLGGDVLDVLQAAGHRRVPAAITRRFM